MDWPGTHTVMTVMTIRRLVEELGIEEVGIFFESILEIHQSMAPKFSRMLELIRLKLTRGIVDLAEQTLCLEKVDTSGVVYQSLGKRLKPEDNLIERGTSTDHIDVLTTGVTLFRKRR